MYGIVCAGARRNRGGVLSFHVWELRNGKVRPNYAPIKWGEDYQSVAACEAFIKDHWRFKTAMLVTEEEFKEECAARQMVVNDLFQHLHATSVEYTFTRFIPVPD